MAYYTPATLKEALLTLGKEAPNIKVLAGGTDLVVALRENRISASSILDISGIRELNFVTEEESRIRIGPLVTHAEVENRPLFLRFAPVLAQACATVGSQQIRNRGTLGGNIANASPAGDSIPALIAMAAEVKIEKTDSQRKVPLEDFFLGPGRSILKPEEMVTSITFPKMSEYERGFFLKLGQRKALAISKVSVAARFTLKKGRLSDVRIALGSVAPRVIRAQRAESILEGSRLSLETIEKAAGAILDDASPIDDIRSSALYRRKMVGRLLFKGLSELLRAK